MTIFVKYCVRRGFLSEGDRKEIGRCLVNQHVKELEKWDEMIHRGTIFQRVGEGWIGDRLTTLVRVMFVCDTG